MPLELDEPDDEEFDGNDEPSSVEAGAVVRRRAAVSRIVFAAAAACCFSLSGSGAYPGGSCPSLRPDTWPASAA